MAERKNQAPGLARTEALGPAFLKWSRWLPLVIIAAMALLSWLVIMQQARAVSLLKARIQEENSLRMQSSQEHVSGYLEEVYSILLFISQNEGVIAMRGETRGFIQKLYDHGWENHQLTELYVVERDFRGDRRPFMAFEHEPESSSLSQIHTASREQEEYRAQMEQIQRFSAQPSLRALLSREILLCVPDAPGERSRGFVYSVPIRSGARLVGIVAGMIRTRTILELLHEGLHQQVAFLVNEQGDLLLDGNADPGIRQWLQQRFASQSVSGFFGQAPQGLIVGHWIALWTPAKILSGEKWWLVLLYDKDEHLQRSVFTGALGHGALASSLLLAGIALALLVQSMNKRLAEQARHLRERKVLERQVQDVSEREQRRIGENLHEDFCQRLTGIEAMSTVLEKRLGAKKLPEARVASEMGQELKDLVTSAREMAEELQPVSLLQAGFLAALEDLAQRTEKRGALACRVEAEGWPDQLDPSVATHFYRIVQEALNNIMAHARATQVVIRLSADSHLLTLTVTDNGVGLREGAAEAPGMGLRIMRYRSDLIGADLQIRSAPGNGTTVRCVCPRPDVAEGQAGAKEAASDEVPE
jgi:signal transduction histidine kinase